MGRNVTTKKVINSNKAPSAIGPYSQAIEANGFVFCSGQIGVDPKSSVVAKRIKDQTKRAMNNLKSVLESAGLDFSSVVRVDIFLKNIGDYNEVNEEYAKFFRNDPPARQTVEVSNLPRNALIEISCIAYKNE